MKFNKSPSETLKEYSLGQTQALVWHAHFKASGVLIKGDDQSG